MLTLNNNSIINLSDTKLCESTIDIKNVLVSAKQLAILLGCSVSYIKKLRSQGRIMPEVTLGRFIRYNYASVVASLKRKGAST